MGEEQGYPSTSRRGFTGDPARHRFEAAYDRAFQRLRPVPADPLANGLTSSVLGRQRTAAEAAAVLRYALDRVFGGSVRPGSG